MLRGHEKACKHSRCCRSAGVSVSAVSKAVNGRYGVSVKTTERVLQVAQALGYESSLVASSMRSRKTGVVGVLVADFEPFSAEVLKGVGAALSDSRYDLLAYSGSRQKSPEGWERRSLSRLSGTLIDGAIMVTPTVVNVSADVPIVAVDPHTGPMDLPTVESDSFGGARNATSYLIDLGHRRIGFVSGRSDLRSAAAREAGYRRGLDEAGIRFNPALVGVGNYDQDWARDAAQRLLTKPDVQPQSSPRTTSQPSLSSRWRVSLGWTCRATFPSLALTIFQKPRNTQCHSPRCASPWATLARLRPISLSRS